MKAKIVEDGARRLINTKVVQKRRKELRRKFEEEYAAELQRSGMIKKLLTRIKIGSLINQSIKEEYQQSHYNLNTRVKL